MNLKLTCAVELIEFIWLFIVDVGGLGGGPDGLLLLCDSDLKNISRFDCNWRNEEDIFLMMKIITFVLSIESC